MRDARSRGRHRGQPPGGDHRQPAKFSRSRPGAYGRPAPWLGQHTPGVLRELGLDTAQVATLLEAGVARDAHPEATKGHATS